MELVLDLLQEQRQVHIRKLQERSDPRVSAAQLNTQLSANDMKEIMNNWRNTPTLWMKADNLAMLTNLWGRPWRDFVVGSEP